jgi:hypothetical protein
MGDIREALEKPPDRRLCFRALARAGKGTRGCPRETLCSRANSETLEPFSALKKKNPLANQGVRWSGKRDLNIYGG